jgi:hypothetical protein
MSVAAVGRGRGVAVRSVREAQRGWPFRSRHLQIASCHLVANKPNRYDCLSLSLSHLQIASRAGCGCGCADRRRARGRRRPCPCWPAGSFHLDLSHGQKPLERIGSIRAAGVRARLNGSADIDSPILAGVAHRPKTGDLRVELPRLRRHLRPLQCEAVVFIDHPLDGVDRLQR